jgi:DNA processing protein
MTLAPPPSSPGDQPGHPGIRSIARSDPRYPPLLGELRDAPSHLWYQGDAFALASAAVAIVGARACSVAAAHVASRLARDLAAAGLVVVSGLARGVDGAAHQGALQGGRTVAVLGSGVDVVYPPEHGALAAGVRARGALVSEWPPGVRPKAWRFPRRNRLIAGLSLGVVVVEAGETSGALITAREALDQGKEVMVVPGSVAGGQNRGGHALLKDGAALVEDARDVLEALRSSTLTPWVKLPSSDAEMNSECPLDAGGLPAGWAVGDELDLDELQELVSDAADSVPLRLLEWELAGRVARTPTGRFVRLCR